MNNLQLDVTACVLSLNRPAYLCEAVASIQSQTRAPSRIIIFDNGSKPDVFAAIEDYLKDGVSFKGAEQTESVFWNFRRVSQEVGSEYVVILHDDDKLCPDFFDKQITFLEKHPDVVAVSCNGYLIDKHGRRNGRLLFPELNNSVAELYRCSADVALRYASDECLPMSPVVYRTKILGQVDFREEYEKVADAVFFCDMADIGVVAYQSNALYECRIHDTQDSSYFSAAVMNRLENFFWSRKTQNPEDLIRLHKKLISQHTARNLRRFLSVIKKPQSIKHCFGEFTMIWDEVFSPLAALKIIITAFTKRLLVFRKR